VSQVIYGNLTDRGKWECYGSYWGGYDHTCCM